MFDDDLPKKKTDEFPRSLDTMSVSNLQNYITELENEIKRVQSNIDKKKASQDAAASVFKI